MIVSNEAEKGVEWIFLIVVKQYVTACCRESVPDTGFASVPDRVSGNAGAWEFVPPVPKEMSNLMPEQIFRISYLGFPIVSLPFYLDTSPRQNTNKICFCTRLIRIFVKQFSRTTSTRYKLCSFMESRHYLLFLLRCVTTFFECEMKISFISIDSESKNMED